MGSALSIGAAQQSGSRVDALGAGRFGAGGFVAIHDVRQMKVTSSIPPRDPLRGRPAIVIPLSLLGAAAAALIAQRLAPPRVADMAMLCAAWIALYPISWLKRSIPWWRHWVQGAFILLGAWFAMKYL